MINLKDEYSKFVHSKRKNPLAAYILGRSLKQIKYYEEIWKYLFRDNDLKSLQLNDYLYYQSWRFRSSNFVPTLNVLLSQKSFDRFKEDRDWFKNKINEIEKHKALFHAKRKTNYLIKKNKFSLNEICEQDKIKKSHLKHKTISLFLFCKSVDFFYNKKSKICKFCKYSKKCKIILKGDFK